MSSVYHIIHKIPILEDGELYKELEWLANELVNSGKLRIDANPASNCIRITIPELYISLAFTTHEIINPELKRKTEKFIYNLWYNKFHSKDRALNKMKETMQILTNEMNKLVPLNRKTEIKIARIIVQSIHPIVTHLLLVDGVEIFVTYGHSIGEMLDIPTWQSAGNNSGMQSTDGRDSAVFISCGGDPLGDTDKDNPTFGDGLPAMARMMIIGAQEMGHFSDIKRDEYGRQISRYSANFSATRATPEVQEGRLNDIQRILDINTKLRQIGFDRLLTIENNYKFYKKMKRRWIVLFFYYFYYHFMKTAYLLRCKVVGLKFVDHLYKQNPLIINTLKIVINDMLFNLEPKADVYARDNKDHADAIACVEALARVPQQVVKWGFDTVKFLSPNLYKIYYRQVIPGCIVAYETISNKKYINKLHFPNFYLFAKLRNSIKNGFKKLTSIFKKKDKYS